MSLKGREIILGVGGGISAYKSAELLRRLQDIGLLITVVPTAASLNFVGKATWEALSGREVSSDLWENTKAVPHISLAKRANAIIIAPTTADLLSKLANGNCDDLLTNLVVASECPKILVPAMHPEMWSNSATVSNVSTLRERRFLIIEPDEGRMTGADYLKPALSAEFEQNADQPNLGLRVQAELDLLNDDETPDRHGLKTRQQDDDRTLAAAHVEAGVGDA